MCFIVFTAITVQMQQRNTINALSSMINTHVCVLTPDIELTSRAYEYYKNALKAGEDGRPDFKARKSCNYMTEAVEVLFS